MEYILSAKPIKVHGAVVASYGSEQHPSLSTRPQLFAYLHEKGKGVWEGEGAADLS